MSVPEDATNQTQAPSYTLIADRFAVLVAGREIVLTPAQFRLLTVLVTEPDRVFTRSELVTRVYHGSVDERTIDVHIKDLRRKLDADAERVETVRGQGYRYRGTTNKRE
jgi:DNA-binding response OmpR family regulator